MAERKRVLNDLRVIDLRAELEKRNLDKSGVRGVLIQRLSKHLEEEGHDPATFTFELGSEVKTPSKRTRCTESTVEPETEEAPAMEDMIVQDDAGEEEESEQVDSQAKEEEPADNDTSEEKMEVDDKLSRKRESKEESEATQPKKPCIVKEEKSEDDPKTENNTDADDSINLDLGEDELLNEETDNTEKNDNKDDAVLEDSAETAGDDSAQADEAAPLCAAPDDDQQEVNAEAPAISNDGETTDKDQKDDKDKESEGDKKEKKDDSKEGGARNLWVSGLSGDTRAKDLKQLCSKHGKVIGAKVVTNAKTPGSRCYGYVTMASPQDAENCIKNLHRTELHGRMISVEKAKSESESASRRQPSRAERRPSKERKDDLKDEEGKEGAEKTGESKPKKEGELSGEESTRSTSRTREKSQKSDKDKTRRSTRSRERKRSPNREVLSFSKIWKERDVARARERSRAAREEERRRRAAEDALRERERRQRLEKHRLAVEREKLRAEREKIEREKNELLRLERERHRLEREKLELERLELKRAQLRLEEERRKRGYEGGAAYRKPAASPPPEPAYERDARHKRPATQAMSTSRGQFEAPPPPRFELPSGYERAADKRDRDYKRDYRHVSSGNMKYPSNGSVNDDSRQAIAPGTRPKEPGRSYESREARAYRPSPPGKPEPRSWSSSSRYPDSATASKGSGEGWSSSEARYSAAYEPRYPPQYQPPPPGVTYPERYAPPATRDYARKY